MRKAVLWLNRLHCPVVISRGPRFGDQQVMFDYRRWGR